MTTTTDAPTLRGTTRVLLGCAWLGLPLSCVFKALELLVHFFGESATAAEEAAAARWLLAATVGFVGIPLVALALGGRRAWRVTLVAGCLLGAFTGAWAADLLPDRAPAPRPYVCQERSGGDTDCPGG